MTTATDQEQGLAAQSAQAKESTPVPAVPRKTKIPTLSPYLAPNVICKNRECSRVLVPKVSTEKGGEPLLQYDCGNCNYSFFASLIHAQGSYKALNSTASNPPEVFQKGK